MMVLGFSSWTFSCCLNVFCFLSAAFLGGASIDKLDLRLVFGALFNAHCSKIKVVCS